MSEYALGVAEMGTLVNLDGLNSGMQDAAEKAESGFGRVGDIIGGALKVGLAAAAGGFLALGGAIVSGIGDAREAAVIMGQTEAAITSTGGAAGKTAEQIGDLASSLSAAEGKSLFGDSDIQLAENLLLTFTNLKGEIFDSATAISVDMAQALGGAPKDQAIALGKALNDPVAGITALTRVGVTFTEQQKAQIEAMVKAGDVAGAQKVILAELNKEFGGSAAAAAKADGGWAQFRDRMGEVAESVGARLLPILNQAFSFLNSAPVQSAIQRIADGLVDFIGTAINAGAALLELGKQAYVWGANIATQFGRGIMQAAAPVVQALQYLGAIIRSWLQPGSPPKLLPQLDEWGAGAATAYMDGWKDADFSAFRSLSSAIEQELKTLVDLGQLSEVDMAPTLARSQEQLARAIATVNAGGDVQGQVWDDLISAMGPAGPQVAGLVRAYFDLERATQEVEQAQRELTEVTERYDAALRPLNAQLQDIRDRKKQIQDMQRIQELQDQLASGELSEADAELARLEIAEIQAEQHVEAVERERDAAVEAAQAKVDAAEQAQQAAQTQVQAQQALIDQGQQTNQLLVGQGQLLDRLAAAADAAAKGAGGAAGSVAGLGGALPDMAANMSAATQPIQDVAAAVGNVGQQVEAIKGRFTTAASDILAFAQSAGGALAEVSLPIQTIRALADQAFPAIASAAALAFGIVASVVRDNGSQMLSDAGAIWEGLRATVDTIASAIAQTVALVFGVIAQFLRDHGTEISAFLGQTWTTIASILTTALELIRGIVMGVFLVIRDFLADHGDAIQTILSGAWMVISNVISAALALIEGILKAALAIFKGDWQGAWEALQHMALSFAESIARAVQGMLEIIAGFFGTSLQQIADVWRHNWDALMVIGLQFAAKMPQLGRDIMAGIGNGINAAAQWLYDLLRGIAEGALQAAKDALGISSPSKVFAEVGSDVIAGWLEGMVDSFPDLLSEFAAMGEELAELAEQIRDTISDTMAGIFSAGASIYQQRAKNRDFITDLGKEVTAERKKVQKDIAATEDKLAKERAKEKPDAGRIKELEDELALLQQQETALKERERQMGQFRKNQAILVSQAEQMAKALFPNDPKRQAAFFALRSKQIQQLAKLEERWFAATSDAERAQIEADIEDVKKAQELEIAAFMEEARQGNATFGDLTDEYDELTKKREDLIAKRADLESQLANEKDDERRAALQAEIDALTDEIGGMDALIEEIEALIAALTATEDATASSTASTSSATMSVASSGASKSASTLSNAEYVNYTVTLRLSDERSSLLKDLIRTEVREELADAGWRGDTRGR